MFYEIHSLADVLLVRICKNIHGMNNRKLRKNVYHIRCWYVVDRQTRMDTDMALHKPVLRIFNIKFNKTKRHTQIYN